MRAELEQVALIEKYLLKKMSADESLKFDASMHGNASLNAEVTAQSQVMGAIKRIGLKTMARSAYKSWIIRKWIVRITFALLLSGLAIGSYWYLTSNKPSEPNHEGNEHVTEIVINNETPTSGSIGFEIEYDTSEFPILSDSKEVVIEDATDSQVSNNSENQLLTSDDPLNFNDQDDNIDTVYTSVQSDWAEPEFPNNPRTYVPKDSFLDSLQQLDDFSNGTVTEQPTFVDGQKALQRYLVQNLRYPESALRDRVQGTVYVSFVIDKNGKVKDAKIVKGVHRMLDKEALKVVADMPNWIPGKVNGEKADLKYTIPVNFIFKGTDIQYSKEKNSAVDTTNTEPLKSDHGSDIELEEKIRNGRFQDDNENAECIELL